MMAKQTFTTGQVLTAAQMTSLQQTAMGGGSATAKTTSYVLVAADAGTTVAMNAAGSTTITVNTGLFSAGDTVFIQNWGAGTCTITAGTATVSTHGSLALSQYEGGQLYFTSSSAAIFFDISQTTGMTNPMTTTGDTIYSSSGSTPARLGIGSTGQVLTVAGGVPSWATPASGGGMTLISEQTASGNTAINFTSISSSYKQLLLVYSGLYQSTADGAYVLRLNNSSSSVYVDQGQLIDGTSASTDYATRTCIGDDIIGFRNSSTTLYNTSSGFVIIDNYSSSTKVKTYSANARYFDNNASAKRAYIYTGFFNDTTAVTSVDIVRRSGTGTLNNLTNTSIRLYGIS